MKYYVEPLNKRDENCRFYLIKDKSKMNVTPYLCKKLRTNRHKDTYFLTKEAAEKICEIANERRV